MSIIHAPDFLQCVCISNRSDACAIIYIAELEQIIARSNSSNLNSNDSATLPPASSSYEPIASTSNFDPHPNPINSDALPPFASSSTSFYSPPSNTFHPTYSPSNNSSRKLQNNFDVLLEATTHSQQQQYSLPPVTWDPLSTSFGNNALQVQGSASGSGQGQTSMFAHVEPTDALLELFYPGWPSSLPSPAVRFFLSFLLHPQLSIRT